MYVCVCVIERERGRERERERERAREKRRERDETGDGGRDPVVRASLRTPHSYLRLIDLCITQL